LRAPDLLRGYKCAHSVRISDDRWPDHIRLPNLEPNFILAGVRATMMLTRAPKGFKTEFDKKMAGAIETGKGSGRFDGPAQS
jgi:hypothetical protein